MQLYSVRVSDRLIPFGWSGVRQLASGVRLPFVRLAIVLVDCFADSRNNPPKRRIDPTYRLILPKVNWSKIDLVVLTLGRISLQDQTRPRPRPLTPSAL